MASGPAAGRSASTQRSTVAGDAKPIVTMIECEAGHTRPDARAARATNSTDQQCPTARAVTSPGQSRIEAIKATCIGICCRAVWLHTAVMQRVLRLSARARLGAVRPAAIAVARQLMPCADTVADTRAVSDETSLGVWVNSVPAAVVAARLFMPCADAVANARAVSEEASVWQGAQLRRPARLRLHRRRHSQKAIVCMP